MFVILAGALLFGLPTLLLKQFQNPEALVPRLLRGFAGGVIVALALVHIVPSVSVASSARVHVPAAAAAAAAAVLGFLPHRHAAVLVQDLQLHCTVEASSRENDYST
jgi:hypothetical protein